MDISFFDLFLNLLAQFFQFNIQHIQLNIIETIFRTVYVIDICRYTYRTNTVFISCHIVKYDTYPIIILITEYTDIIELYIIYTFTRCPFQFRPVSRCPFSFQIIYSQIIDSHTGRCAYEKFIQITSSFLPIRIPLHILWQSERSLLSPGLCPLR